MFCKLYIVSFYKALLLLSMLKTDLLLNIFADTVFQDYLLNKNSNYWHLFEIHIFCKTINTLILTFDQINASLLNKSIHFY